MRHLRRTVDLVGRFYLRAIATDATHYSATTTPANVRLTAFEGSLYLELAQRFTVGRDPSGRFGDQWRCHTIAYSYKLSLDEGGREELVAWHWHPAVPSQPRPHAHVNGDKTHVPTGRVSLEEVVRHVILEYGVGGRPGWSDVLDENEELFNYYRSWP